MSGENTASGEAKAVQMEDGGEGRDRSTIGFPYNNLNDAIDVARAIHSNAGSGDCDDVQLAAWLNMSPKSSGYRVQLSAARMFQLVETASGQHKLTALGKMVVDPQREREARAKAFMNVPLYARVYENYKGGVIPPAAAFERDIVGLGVAEKQKGRARQVFEKSAEQAGFFEHGKNRLVMPGIAARADEKPKGEEEKVEEKGRDGSSGGGGSEGLCLDPLLVALLKKIPATGNDWPAGQRVRWFKTFAMNVSQIYDGDGEPVEMKIELEAPAS